MAESFNSRLQRTLGARASLVCVGLDPDPARLGGRDPVRYLLDVIEATAPFVAAFKPNLAFFEQYGPAGLEMLQVVLRGVPEGAIVIGDAKRGDIGHTAAAYAAALFDVYGFDAVTANPWGGSDSLEPFLSRPDRGCFAWCRSSNPGGADFQELRVATPGGERPLYEVVAERVVGWGRNGNAGLVVGATQPEELARVRAIAPDLPILVPGVGAQGGGLAASVRAARDAEGRGFLVASSRSVLYASAGDDYARAAAVAARDLRDAIEQAQRAA